MSMMSLHSLALDPLRLDCNSSGTKTAVPIRPIAVLSGVLDVNETYIRLFWVADGLAHWLVGECGIKSFNPQKMLRVHFYFCFD